MQTNHENVTLPQAPYPFKVHETKKVGRPIRIKPSFHQYLTGDFEFNLYIAYIEHLIEKAFPHDLLLDFKNAASHAALQKVFQKFEDQLPIIHYSYPEEAPGLLYVNMVCSAEYTHGVGRFMTDTLSRWLMPGKILAVFCSPSLNFRFIDHDKSRYFIQQNILEVVDTQELNAIKNNLPSLIRELRLTVLAVKHARNVISLKHLTSEQQAAVIQENFESLFDRPSKEFDQSLFDQVHQFLIKASADEKINQINARMAPLHKQRPNVFEADIFHEIQHFVFLFRDRFTATRDLRHIMRLIAFQYLFRKSLKQEASSSPSERHLAFKLLHTKLVLPSGNKTVLGILVGMNILRDNEMFEQKHAFEAIQHCIPDIKPVKDSYVLDRRDQDKIRLFYIEVEKKDGSSFTIAETKELKKRLPRELKASVESSAHPIFMPRNEEEVMRNIVLLSQELKYVRDIPQVVISFDTQTESDLLFTVILLRILPRNDVTLSELFQHSYLRFQDFDVKQVGWVRKKYIKEANIFTAKIDKKPFLRKDYSLDLFKARQAVSSELARLLGDVRDFNGGILSKQQELFHELHQALLLSHQNNDYLLESFFYSITPPLMQSILPASILKTLYLMMVEALEHDFKRDPFFLKTHWDPEYLLLLAAAQKKSFKEAVFQAINQLKIPTSDLSFTFVTVYEIPCLGYIYRCEDPKQCALFYNSVEQTMRRWENEIK